MRAQRTKHKRYKFPSPVATTVSGLFFVSSQRYLMHVHQVAAYRSLSAVSLHSVTIVNSFNLSKLSLSLL